MSDQELEETRCLWNNLAEDWLIQVGDEGARNRIQNSDPVLWQFAGSVRGLRVMDAHCGTGYLSNKLYLQGANVIGVDFALVSLKLPALAIQISGMVMAGRYVAVPSGT